MEALKNILTEKIKAHINLKDDVKSLETKLQGLRCRKGDIELQVREAERPGTKKRKGEVTDWLEKVEQIDKEFKALDDRIQEGGLCWLFRNICSPGDVAKMDTRVKDLIEQFQHFGELCLDDLGNKGEPQVITKLIGQMFSEGLKSIKKWLVTDKISNIGIYGMGGVGKTTLAKHIHNYFLEKNEFKVYWITVSQEFSLKKLQDDIAKHVNLQLSHIVDEDTRAAKLSRALTQQQCSVLIILDDVWEGISLERIGIPLAPEKCKLILTTRSLDVCKRMGCQKEFDVKTLDANESWELFKDKLGPECDRILPTEIKEIAKSVAKECAGLPLGIVTLAGSMRGIEDIHEWTNALEQLQKCSIGHEEMGKDVFRILEWSFNQLNECQKHCFLYCSLYPEDWKIEKEELVNLFIGAELMRRRDTRQSKFDQGHTILNQLVRVGLLEKTSHWKARECVQMHDLIRDMAIRITSGESVQKIKDVPRFLVKSEGAKQKEWTEDLDAVSIWFMEEEILSDMSPKCSKLSTLLLCNGKIKTIPDSFFRHMGGLKVLNLEGCRYLTELPNCVSEMVNLTALILQGCENLAYVPPLGKLKQLRELNLSGSGIKHIPKGLEELVRLESLEMDGNLEEEIPADMSPKCPKLLTLLFRYGKIKRIPDSFFRHMGELKVLNLEGCMYLRNLPNCVSEMVNLTALILQGCKELAYVPPLGKLKQLRELNLSDSGIKHIPKGLEELVRLESLEMDGNLEEEIPADMSPKCPKLLTLLFRYGKIKRIPDSFFRHMGELKVLNLVWCMSLRNLPNCVSEMVNLTALILQGCKELAYVPPLGKLKQLRELNLSHSGIKHLPEGLKELINLESLEMVWTNLEEEIIPKGTLSELHRLKQLKLPVGLQVCDPEVLNQLDVFHGHLSFTDICEPFKISRWPKHYALVLLVEGFSSMDFDWDEFLLGAKGKKLAFDGCNFRDAAPLPKVIQYLEFNECVVEQSDVVFQILNSSNDLLDLTINSLEGVEFLLKASSPPPLDSELIGIPYALLPNLRSLSLEDLPDLVGLFDYKLPLPPGTFSSLDSVWISGCHKMRKLFTVQLLQSLKYLKELNVRDCEELEEIIGADEEEARGSGPTNTLTLPPISELYLSGLPRLKNICKATIIRNSIKKIIVIKCPNVKRLPLFLPINDGQLSPPITLYLGDLPDFSGFFDNQLLLPPGTFSSLRDVTISRCDKMRKLFTVQLLQSLKNLKKLDVSDCKEVEEIIGADEEEARGSPSTSSGPTNSTHTLPQLSKLYLSWLPRLKNICKATIICNSIQETTVGGCPNVKRLPLFLPINDEQPSPPITLYLGDLPDFLGFFDNQLLLPPGTFSSLRDVTISRCDKMRKLFTVQFLQSLKNLKELDVSDCKELEEIIGADEEEARGSPSTSSRPTNTLRKLPLPPGTFSSLEFTRLQDVTK